MVIITQKTSIMQQNPLIRRVEVAFVHGQPYTFTMDIAPTKAQAQLICFGTPNVQIKRSDCFPMTDEADALELTRLFFEKFTQ